jgi:ribose transport system substrate-binding protein
MGRVARSSLCSTRSGRLVPDEIKAVKEGLVVSLVAQNPFRMDYDGVNQAVNRIRGGTDVELRSIGTSATLITKDNVNDPDVQSLLHPSCKNPPP